MEEENKVDEKEKKVKEEVKDLGKEKTTPAKNEGAKFETTPVIERAREEREKLEAANTKREELLDREEAIMVKRELGGTGERGVVEKKKTETDEEFTERFKNGEVNLFK